MSDANIKVTTRADAENVLGELAKVKAEHALHTNTLTLAMQDARAQFEPAIEKANASIKALVMALEMWASQNPNEFGDKKSIDMLHGTVGFRIGQRALKLRARMKWDDVLERLRAFKRGKYVRTTEDVDKKAILSDEAAGELNTADMTTIGVRVDQAESFYTDTKTV
jgi:phage host-nuclease inhibitor protein Gam